jgi:hypothetical protein
MANINADGSYSATLAKVTHIDKDGNEVTDLAAVTIGGKAHIGQAGAPELQAAMGYAGATIDAKQKQMAAIMTKENLSGADSATLNGLNNDIALLGSAQKALNQAASQAQKMISA